MEDVPLGKEYPCYDPAVPRHRKKGRCAGGRVAGPGPHPADPSRERRGNPGVVPGGPCLGVAGLGLRHLSAGRLKPRSYGVEVLGAHGARFVKRAHALEVGPGVLVVGPGGAEGGQGGRRAGPRLLVGVHSHKSASGFHEVALGDQHLLYPAGHGRVDQGLLGPLQPGAGVGFGGNAPGRGGFHHDPHGPKRCVFGTRTASGQQCQQHGTDEGFLFSHSCSPLRVRTPMAAASPASAVFIPYNAEA